MFRQLAVPLAGGDLAASSLILTELVSNAIRHGSSGRDEEIEVEIIRSDGSLKMHVTQGGALYDPHEVRLREPGNTRGWGVLLLDRLCSSWGVDPDSRGVWAEMDIDR